MTAITSTGAPMLNIPKPGQVAGRVAPRVTKPVPTLGTGKHEDAIYWLETNIGIAFEHVGRLQHLRDHYGNQLRVVQDVHSEWEHKADREHQYPGQYAHPDDKAKFARAARVCKICKKLVVTATQVLGDPWPLAQSEADQMRRLREHLAALPEAEPAPHPGDSWTHRGECATIRAAQIYEKEQLDAGLPRPVQVLGTNDAKAAKLAFNHGLADRSTAGILREMVLANVGNLTAERAWELHTQMLEVAGMSHTRQPAGPQYFMTT